MKRMVFSLSFLLFVSGMYAQITLEECQRKTQENYPLVHQYGLVEKTKEYNLENAAKGNLPQFALSAKASYQSDVTELPVKIPGVELKRLPKDQYQVMLELQQKIWDGGGIRMQKKQTIAEADGSGSVTDNKKIMLTFLWFGITGYVVILCRIEKSIFPSGQHLMYITLMRYIKNNLIFR